MVMRGAAFEKAARFSMVAGQLVVSIELSQAALVALVADKVLDLSRPDRCSSPLSRDALSALYAVVHFRSDTSPSGSGLLPLVANGTSAPAPLQGGREDEVRQPPATINSRTAASLLGISQRGVRYAAASGALSGVEDGGWRFSRAEVLAFRAKREERNARHRSEGESGVSGRG